MSAGNRAYILEEEPCADCSRHAECYARRMACNDYKSYIFEHELTGDKVPSVEIYGSIFK